MKTDILAWANASKTNVRIFSALILITAPLWILAAAIDAAIRETFDDTGYILKGAAKSLIAGEVG